MSANQKYPGWDQGSSGENSLGYGLAGAPATSPCRLPSAQQLLVNVAIADQNAARFMREIVGHGGVLVRRRGARIRGVPHMVTRRHCKIVALANREPAAIALILSPAG
jgi:hypothetical protein